MYPKFYVSMSLVDHISMCPRFYVENIMPYRPFVAMVLSVCPKFFEVKGILGFECTHLDG